jgi:hypothetical protein
MPKKMERERRELEGRNCVMDSKCRKSSELQKNENENAKVAADRSTKLANKSEEGRGIETGLGTRGRRIT